MSYSGCKALLDQHGIDTAHKTGRIRQYATF
jgi:hypothetical protein